ncbi:Uncharacterised protein [Mycobacteroides abscessus subsp. abscessus]|nr:Uncharacterised protein [Mycobacteroides abscessus subsp. abscessus]
MPRYAPHQIWVDGSSCRNAQSPSSITTTVPARGHSSSSRRPVVMSTGSPMPFSTIRCRAVKAEIAVIPGTTSYSKAAGSSTRIASRIRRVLSYREGSPHARNAPVPPSGRSDAIALAHRAARSACH